MKEARKAAGVSAEKVAEFLGVSPATIYRYENGQIGKIPVEYAVPLSEYLGVSAEYLIGFDVDMKPDGNKPSAKQNEDIPQNHGIVIPDNAKFINAYRAMTEEERQTLIEIFNRAYKRQQKKSEDDPTFWNPPL